MARRRSKRAKRQSRQAILNFVLAGLAVAIIAFSFYALQPEPYDEVTLCEISDELPPHTAVIIDKTDEYSEQQADLIAAIVRRTRDRLEIGERLTLFELDQFGQFDPRGEFSLCNPGRGDQVNALFRNPQQIEKRFNEKFDQPMERILEDLVVPKEAPNSPVLEALARLGQTEAFSDRAPRRRIVIISDMLQNSDVFTAYGGGGAIPENMPDALSVADATMRRFGDSLEDVALEVRLIPRQRYVDMQRGALKDYWNDVFRELGVSVAWRDL